MEVDVLAFAKAYQINLSLPIKSKELEEILIEEYGYTINNQELDTHDELDNLRSVFIPKNKILLVANRIDDAQRAFIYAKEIAYNYLKIEERLNTFPWIKFEKFDQVINNFYASYFAGALIISRKKITEQLSQLFAKEKFDKDFFLNMISSYNASPESFYQRLTNVLPKDFTIQNLFFLRFTHRLGSKQFYLKKELHLAHQQSPRANELNAHYCRRWISLKVLNVISEGKMDHVFDLQISNFTDDDQQYLVLSSATRDPFRSNHYRSIAIGILINRQLKNKVQFLQDDAIKTIDVGVTCERCAIKNCEVRQVPAHTLNREIKNLKTESVVKDIVAKFSS